MSSFRYVVLIKGLCQFGGSTAILMTGAFLVLFGFQFIPFIPLFIPLCLIVGGIWGAIIWCVMRGFLAAAQAYVNWK
jgi:hypothetical protein